MRILIIEDEELLREQLRIKLQEQGYSIDTAGDGIDGEFIGREYPIDLAIVDLGLPGMSGLDVIRKWREQGKDFPVLILTARGRWQEKVKGLEAGADDYVVKPFQIEEIIARLNALLRRSAGFASPVLRFPPVELDTSRQELKVSDQVVDLTAYEYKVLEYLMVNCTQVVSKTTLTEHIYEQDFDKDSNTIEVFIRRLRQKIDPDNTLKPIETLRGRGYRFALEAVTAD